MVVPVQIGDGPVEALPHRRVGVASLARQVAGPPYTMDLSFGDGAIGSS